MCVCVRVCARMYLCLREFKFVRACVRGFVSVCMHVCSYVHSCEFMFASVSVCVRTCDGLFLLCM